MWRWGTRRHLLPRMVVALPTTTTDHYYREQNGGAPVSTHPSLDSAPILPTNPSAPMQLHLRLFYMCHFPKRAKALRVVETIRRTRCVWRCIYRNLALSGRFDISWARVVRVEHNTFHTPVTGGYRRRAHTEKHPKTHKIAKTILVIRADLAWL